MNTALHRTHAHLNLVLAALLFSVVAFPAHGALAAEWEGSQAEEGGVLHVRNPETAMLGQLTLEPEELWRLGGDSDDDDEFFGVVSEVVRGPEGEFYLLDSQLSEIKVFSGSGEYLRTIGREGEGPGEFRNPSDMFYGFDGTVGVVQIFPGRIILLTSDGDPGGNFPLPDAEGGGFQLVHWTQGSKDRVLVAGAVQNVVEGRTIQTTYLRAYDAEGQLLAEYHETESETRFGNMEFVESEFADFARRWRLTPDGQIIVATSFNDYELQVYNADGTIDRVIHREHVPVARTSEQMETYQRMWDQITSWNPGSTFKVSKTHMVISHVFARDDGSLWVRADEGTWALDEGHLASFDVFDAEGRYVRQVNIKLPGNPVDDAVFIMGDRLVVVTGQFSSFMNAMGAGEEEDEAEDVEPMSVICYSLESVELQ